MLSQVLFFIRCILSIPALLQPAALASPLSPVVRPCPLPLLCTSSSGTPLCTGTGAALSPPGPTPRVDGGIAVRGCCIVIRAADVHISIWPLLPFVCLFTFRLPTMNVSSVYSLSSPSIHAGMESLMQQVDHTQVPALCHILLRKVTFNICYPHANSSC